MFDTSVNGEPLQFTVGKRDIIAGFEQAIMRIMPGKTKTTKISAHRAYGPHREDLVVEVDKKSINDDVSLQIGQLLQIKQPDEEEFTVTVTELSDQKVKLDANHPLAGENLTFDINLIEIVTV